MTEFVILCFQSAFLPLDRIRLVIYLIFKLLEIRQRLGECQLSWCRLVSVSICNITQLLPLTQSITSKCGVLFFKNKQWNSLLMVECQYPVFWRFFPCHSMLLQVPFLYVLWRCFYIRCTTVMCIYFWSRKCWVFSRAFYF